jgi:signal transduction histidine kinase
MVKAVRSCSREAATCADLEKIEKIMRGTIDYCRRLARASTAFGFIHGSLRESLERFLDGVNELSNLRCELNWRTTVALRDRAVAYNIYRIAQEAVTNAVRHSGGQRIHVQFGVHNERLVMEVDDDGRGIDPRRAGGSGVGIETMRFRARSYGGGLEVLPRVPRGTRIRCEIPLPLANTQG